MIRYENGHKMEVFLLKEAWKIALDNIVLPIEWNAKGAAYAGASTELKRHCEACRTGGTVHHEYGTKKEIGNV